MNVLGVIDHPIVSLMNPIETKLYLNRGPYWPIYDALNVSSWLFPDRVIKRQVMWNCDVELHGLNTRGMVAIDHLGLTVPNVNVIELFDHEAVKEVMLWTVSRANINTRYVK